MRPCLVHTAAHVLDSGAQTDKDRLTDQEMPDVQFAHFGDGGDGGDVVKGQAVACVNL